MKRLAIGIAACVAAAASTGAMAQDTPDLTGTWQVKATGIGHPHPAAEKAETPRTLIDGTFEFVIDWQDGVRFSGLDVVEEVAAGVGAATDETFSGIVGPTGTTAHIVDDNGSFDCTIVSPDRLDCIYRHIAPGASLVATTIWTRQP